MTLQEIVAQLESCGFTCQAGPLEKNAAFVALKAMAESEIDFYDHPLMGYCDVDGCEDESTSQGICWRNAGYWHCCAKHNAEYRNGSPQPKMNQTAIDREASRDENGILPRNI